MQIIREENAARKLGLRNQHPQTAAPAAEDGDGADKFDNLHPGQRITIELPLAPQGLLSPDSDGCGASSDREGGRFTATLMDVEGNLAKSAAQQCAVFLVPQVSLV